MLRVQKVTVTNWRRRRTTTITCRCGRHVDCLPRIRINPNICTNINYQLPLLLLHHRRRRPHLHLHRVVLHRLTGRQQFGRPPTRETRMRHRFALSHRAAHLVVDIHHPGRLNRTMGDRHPRKYSDQCTGPSRNQNRDKFPHPRTSPRIRHQGPGPVQSRRKNC